MHKFTPAQLAEFSHLEHVRRYKDDDVMRLQGIHAVRNAYENGMPAQVTQRKRANGVIEPDDNVRTNMVRYILNRSRAQTLGDLNGLVSFNDKTHTEDFLEAAERKGFFPALIDGATSGGQTGHIFFETTVDKMGLPKQTNLDTANITPIYADDSYEDVWGFVYRFVGESGKEYKRIWRPISESDLVDGADIEEYSEHWIIEMWYLPQGFTDDDNMTSWVLQEREMFPYPWCPITHWKNLPNPNVFWGEPDLTYQMYQDLCLANRVFSEGVRTHRSYANPVRWGYGIPRIRKAIEKIASNFKTKKDTSYADEPAAKLLPGEFIAFNDPDGKLGHDAVNLQTEKTIDLVKEIRKGVLKEAHTISIDHEELSKMGDISGVALKTLYTDAIDRTKEKRELYGPGIKELVWKNMFVLYSREVVKYRDISLKWDEIVPSNDYEKAQIAAIKANIGIKLSAIAEEMGYSREEYEALEQEMIQQQLEQSTPEENNEVDE